MPVLTLYRRHKKSCNHRACHRNLCKIAQPRADGKPAKCACRCPFWADGLHEGQKIRKSLRETTWEAAADALERLKKNCGRLPERSENEPTTIEYAVERYLADAQKQNLHESTIYKYRSLFSQLKAFAVKKGIRYVKQLGLETLAEFREGWKDGPRSSAKKLERLRSFFRFTQERDWIAKNPASNLKAPKVTLCPTMPYTREEMLRILAAIDKYKDAFPSRGRENALRLRGLILLLRYSGMRIGDAVSLTRDRINGDRLFLYTQKTGVAVNTVLPDFVLKALEATPKIRDEHFFWDGTGRLDTTVGTWRKRLAKLFELAEVHKGHAHRFRDTFAVELLLSGVPMERVSVLLGHQSVRITEKHYAPWVRSRQEQLEADLRQAWEHDPVALLQAEGTPQVHGKNGRIN